MPIKAFALVEATLGAFHIGQPSIGDDFGENLDLPDKLLVSHNLRSDCLNLRRRLQVHPIPALGKWAKHGTRCVL